MFPIINPKERNATLYGLGGVGEEKQIPNNIACNGCRTLRAMYQANPQNFLWASFAAAQTSGVIVSYLVLVRSWVWLRGVPYRWRNNRSNWHRICKRRNFCCRWNWCRGYPPIQCLRTRRIARESRVQGCSSSSLFGFGTTLRKFNRGHKKVDCFNGISPRVTRIAERRIFSTRDPEASLASSPAI